MADAADGARRGPGGVEAEDKLVISAPTKRKKRRWMDGWMDGLGREGGREGGRR